MSVSTVTSIKAGESDSSLPVSSKLSVTESPGFMRLRFMRWGGRPNRRCAFAQRFRVFARSLCRGRSGVEGALTVEVALVEVEVALVEVALVDWGGVRC